MGLDVAEISELATLRPIQTALSGVRATAGPGTDNGAADTGSVTPTARSARSATETGEEEDAGAGSVTPRASGSMAMRPIAPQQQDDGVDVGFATPLATGGVIGPRYGRAAAGDEGSFTTPTTADSALLPATVCPPAPRRSAAAPTRKRAPLQQRLFYPVPSDLTTVFLAVPQCPPPAKKTRAHAVDSPSVPRYKHSLTARNTAG